MTTRIEWHHRALDDFGALDKTTQQRIVDALGRLRKLDDPRNRLLPYVENLKGFWKLRVGDFRVVCEMRRDLAGEFVLVVHVVHRSRACSARSIRTIRDRANDN